MTLNFRSIPDLARTIADNLYKVPRDVDLVVGVPRSGLMAASILALELNLPLTHVDGFVAGDVFQSGQTRTTRNLLANSRESKHTLLLDDSVASGRSIREARERLLRCCPDLRLTTAAVFAAPRSRKFVDFYFEICPTPRIFSWNYLHSHTLGNCCLDIDGVLCRDPSPEENDDGPRYLEFLRSADVLRLPTYEVGWLVTSRLERYRPETEGWLSRHNIKYKNLVMLEGCTAEERRRTGIHGEFKASVYSAVGAHLFIESDAGQAEKIAHLSGKQVLCSSTQRLFDPDVVSLQYGKQSLLQTFQRAKRVLRRWQQGQFP